MAERDPISVLLVEDNVAEAELVHAVLAFERRPRFTTHHVTRLSDGLEALAENTFDVVLLDLGLPDAIGLEGVKAIRAAAPGPAIVVRSGMGEEDVALDALQSGAQDYISKSARDSNERLPRSIRYALARRQAEATARHLAAIVESSDDAIIGQDPDGRITTFNPGAERLYGYTAAEAIGQPFALLLGSEERRHRRKDGSFVEVSLTTSAVEDSSGTVMGAATIARDVTDQRRAAAELEKARRRFAQAFEEAPTGMALTDLDGRFVLVYRALSEITGHPEDQLLATGIASVLEPERKEAWDEAVRGLMEGQLTTHRADTAPRRGRAAPSPSTRA